MVEMGGYPFNIPGIKIERGLALLILELPARYQPMMPNGLGYVYEILKRCRIQFRMIDLNIILYHRYHSRRIIEGSLVIKPSGYIMKEDPWDNTNMGEWEKDEVIEFFWPQIEDVLLKIITNPPKAIGLSVHANNRTLSNRFIRELRVRMPELTIVVGGYDCFYSYLGPNLIPDFDYMVIGESELTLEPLVMALARDERPKDLPGIISRYDSPERRFVEPPLPVDLDSIGFPKYEWTDLSLYWTYKGDHLVPITASRGCNWGGCRFCSEILPFRKRSPQSVVEEIEYFVSNGFHIFHFNESDVNGDPKNLYDICSGVINRGLKVKLVGQLRISKHNNPEYFRHLARAGFVHLRFGVDGWSENTLKLQRKGYNMEMVFQNLRDCHHAGIWTTVNMVIGVPGETEEDISESIDNIARCKKYIDLVESLNILILRAGSEYYRNPDLYKIRFHGDKDAIYRNHSYYIPSELWYSEDPFIDHETRVKRLDRICAGLHENGVKIGGFTERAVRHLLEGDADSYEGVHFGKVKKEEPSHPEVYGEESISIKTFKEVTMEDKRSSQGQRDFLREVLTPKPPPQQRIVWKIKNLFSQTKSIGSKGSSPQPVLVEEGCNGYNIVYFDGSYYALHQLEGAFHIKRFRQGRYKKCFTSDTPEEVKHLMEDAHPLPIPVLVEEGYLGFNIIAFGNKYCGIGREEGYFDIEKVNKKVYRRLVEGKSLEEVKFLIRKG